MALSIDRTLELLGAGGRRKRIDEQLRKTQRTSNSTCAGVFNHAIMLGIVSIGVHPIAVQVDTHKRRKA